MCIPPYFCVWRLFKIATKKFDKEYSTQWYTEVAYLSDHGVPYEFVKLNEQGITVYKYKKTEKLFRTLCDLYEKLGITE